MTTLNEMVIFYVLWACYRFDNIEWGKPYRQSPRSHIFFATLLQWFWTHFFKNHIIMVAKRLIIKKKSTIIAVRLTKNENRDTFDSFNGGVFGFFSFLTVLLGCFDSLDSFDSFESGWGGLLSGFDRFEEGCFSCFVNLTVLTVLREGCFWCLDSFDSFRSFDKYKVFFL